MAHDQEVAGSNRILKGCKQFASYYIKEKIKNKGSQMGHLQNNIFFKELLIKSFVCCFRLLHVLNNK